MARTRTSFYRRFLIKFDYLSHSNLDEAENASASKKLSVLGVKEREEEGGVRKGAVRREERQVMEPLCRPPCSDTLRYRQAC